MENGEIGTDNSTTIKDMEMETNRIEETKYPNKQQKIPGHKNRQETQQPVSGRDSRPHNNRGLQNRPFHQEQRRPYNQQGYQRDHYPQGPQNRPPYYEQWRPYNHQGYQRDYHSQGPRPQYNYPPNYRNTWNRPIQQGPYQHYDEYRNGSFINTKDPIMDLHNIKNLIIEVHNLFNIRGNHLGILKYHNKITNRGTNKIVLIHRIICTKPQNHKDLDLKVQHRINIRFLHKIGIFS